MNNKTVLALSLIYSLLNVSESHARPMRFGTESGNGVDLFKELRMDNPHYYLCERGVQ